MENPQKAEGPPKKSREFRLFAAKRIILGTVGVLALLWLASYVLNLVESHEAPHTPPIVADHGSAEESHTAAATEDHSTPPAGTHTAAVEASHAAPSQSDEPHGQIPADQHPVATKTTEKPHVTTSTEDITPRVAKDDHAPAGHGAATIYGVKGVAFVVATIAPLHHELNDRFYGWRPNDIIRLTDNVNQFQLGALEVTRRTAEALAERISRTGSAQAFEKDLERARNKLMINADDYMLPSAEASYEDALEALGRYRQKLENGTAFFFTRTDNLIPLLQAYENLLGSCDDNLIKANEDDGSEVGWFQSD
nr:DUF2333 family protein [Desulfobacterales bacterium]